MRLNNWGLFVEDPKGDFVQIGPPEGFTCYDNASRHCEENCGQLLVEAAEKGCANPAEIRIFNADRSKEPGHFYPPAYARPA